MIFERQPVTRGARWLESIVITVAAPVLGSLVVPADPYLLDAPFPWLAFAPVLVALQHGVWAGLFSTLLLCAGAVWQALGAGPLPASFASWGIGCLVLAVVAGQFRDSLRGKLAQHEERTEDLQDRLERSERTRHLIQLSHAKLVERVAASRSSLVAAIDGAQQRMAEASNIHDLAQALLDVLASQGNLHAASLYLGGPSGSELRVHPIATFGGSGENSAQHPLVVRAFSTGKLAAIVDAGDTNVADKSVLAAVPLITSQRQILGVVAVHQMPFMAFQADHLNQVFVLAGHLSDMLFDRSNAVASVLRELPDDELEVPPAREPSPRDDAFDVAPARESSPPTEVFVDYPSEVDSQPEPEEVPDPMEDATISIEVETPSEVAEQPRVRPSAPRIDLPPPRTMRVRKAAPPAEPIAATRVITRVETRPVTTPAMVARIETKSVRVPNPSLPAHPEPNPLKRTLHLLVPERPSTMLPPTPAPEPPPSSAPAPVPVPVPVPALAQTPPVAPTDPAKIPTVRVPRAPKREDVTETRLVQRPRAYDIRSKHVTRTFPAVKLPKLEAEPQPEAASDRPRAQVSIRSQVAEAASRTGRTK